MDEGQSVGGKITPSKKEEQHAKRSGGFKANENNE